MDVKCRWAVGSNPHFPSSPCCRSPRSINMVESLPYSEETCPEAHSWLGISLQLPPISLLKEDKALSAGCLLSTSCLSSAPSVFLLYCPHKITQDLSDIQGPPSARTLGSVRPCWTARFSPLSLGCPSLSFPTSFSALLPVLHPATTGSLSK